MPMNTITTLLKPRVWPLTKGGTQNNRRGGVLRLFIFGTVGILFWAGIFAIVLRVLKYFKNVDEIGDILALKLLSMVLITSLALLIFSSILTTLSKLYLSKDLFLVHSLPVPAHKIFIARWLDSTVESSWMVIVYTLPVFIAYGIAYQTGPFFYFLILFAMVAMALIASGFSAITVMIAVVIIPASRMRNVFLFMGILFFVVIYLTIRLVKPELMVDPDVFSSVLVYVTALQTPSSPLLPSTWAFDSLRAGLSGSVGSALFHLALSWTFAGTIGFVALILADKVYFLGFSKTQTGASRMFTYKTSLESLFRFLPGTVRAYLVKEIRTFFRDQTQWSQLFLIGTLIVIYVYNFDALPLEKSPIKTVYLQNLLAFLNMGLATFVLTAVTARFAYPAISTEKEAFWLVKSSPLPLRTYLWIKFLIYYLPLFVLCEILIIATNLLLQVTPFMMILSVLTVFLVVPGIVAMGIGLGAAYPDFKAENPTQTVTSFGGLIFMILCAGFIGTVIMLESGPVYSIFMAGIRGDVLSRLEWLWTIVSFSLVVVLSILALLLPMRFGARRLAEFVI